MPTAMSLASRAEAAVPRRGGHLRLALPRGADADALVMAATGNTLTERGPDRRVAGELAERFESNRGGLRWVFDLRPGVAFQDGRTLEARHVAEALTAAPLPRHIVTVDPDGADRVVVTLDRPDPDLPERLSAPRFGIFRRDETGRRIGTGAYRAIGSDPAAIGLVRVEDYWKPGRGHVDRATVVLIDAAADRQAAVMSGKVDYAAPIPTETVAFLNHLPDVEIAAFRATAALIVDAPAADAGAQQTIRWLKRAISRTDLIDRALLGQGEIGNDTARRPTGQEGPATSPDTPVAARGPCTLDPGNADGFARALASMAAPMGLSLDIGATQDATLRARIVAAEELTESVDWEAEVFLPAWANGLAAHSSRLRHGALTDGAPNDAHRLIERWWFG